MLTDKKLESNLEVLESHIEGLPAGPYGNEMDIKTELLEAFEYIYYHLTGRHSRNF